MRITVRNADNHNDIYIDEVIAAEADETEDEALASRVFELATAELVAVEIELVMLDGESFGSFEIDEIGPEQLRSITYSIRKKTQQP
jgi:hypothetical protein